MDYHLRLLADSDGLCPLNGGLLGFMVGRVFLGVVASHGPSILSFNYMLIWHGRIEARFSAASQPSFTYFKNTSMRQTVFLIDTL